MARRPRGRGDRRGDPRRRAALLPPLLDRVWLPHAAPARVARRARQRPVGRVRAWLGARSPRDARELDDGRRRRRALRDPLVGRPRRRSAGAGRRLCSVDRRDRAVHRPRAAPRFAAGRAARDLGRLRRPAGVGGARGGPARAPRVPARARSRGSDARACAPLVVSRALRDGRHRRLPRRVDGLARALRVGADRRRGAVRSGVWRAAGARPQRLARRAAARRGRPVDLCLVAPVVRVRRAPRARGWHRSGRRRRAHRGALALGHGPRGAAGTTRHEGRRGARSVGRLARVARVPSARRRAAVVCRARLRRVRAGRSGDRAATVPRRGHRRRRQRRERGPRAHPWLDAIRRRRAVGPVSPRDRGRRRDRRARL